MSPWYLHPCTLFTSLPLFMSLVSTSLHPVHIAALVHVTVVWYLHPCTLFTSLPLFMSLWYLHPCTLFTSLPPVHVTVVSTSLHHVHVTVVSTSLHPVHILPPVHVTVVSTSLPPVHVTVVSTRWGRPTSTPSYLPRVSTGPKWRRSMCDNCVHCDDCRLPEGPWPRTVVCVVTEFMVMIAEISVCSNCVHGDDFRNQCVW